MTSDIGCMYSSGKLYVNFIVCLYSPGTAPAIYGMECMLDHVATFLKKDHLEVRKINLMQDGDVGSNVNMSLALVHPICFTHSVHPTCFTHSVHLTWLIDQLHLSLHASLSHHISHLTWLTHPEHLMWLTHSAHCLGLTNQAHPICLTHQTHLIRLIHQIYYRANSPAHLTWLNSSDNLTYVQHPVHFK